MTDQPLPPCGCKIGCQHKDHPQYAPQRSCRLGYVRPSSHERGKTRPCALDDPHPGHVRTTGAWCPGLDEDPPEPEVAPEIQRAADAARDLVALMNGVAATFGPVLDAILTAAIPALREWRDALEALAEHDRQRPTGAPQHGPAHDPFRRQGRG